MGGGCGVGWRWSAGLLDVDLRTGKRFICSMGGFGCFDEEDLGAGNRLGDFVKAVYGDAGAAVENSWNVEYQEIWRSFECMEGVNECDVVHGYVGRSLRTKESCCEVETNTTDNRS